MREGEMMGNTGDDRKAVSRGYLHGDFRLFHNTDTLGTEVGIHFHDFYKVTCVKYGTGRYMIDGKFYDIKSGDIILVGKNVPHQPFFTEGELYDRYTLYISPAMIEDFDIPDCHIYDLFSSGSGNVIRPKEEDAEKFENLLKRIENENVSSSYAAHLAARLYVMGFLVETGRTRENSALIVPLHLPEDDIMLNVLRYVNDKLCENISAAEVAEHHKIDEQSMLSDFKSAFGCSMQEYITNRRLTKAREMIQEGAAPSDACYACGFGSYTGFTEAYRKKFGSAPRLMLKDDAKRYVLTDFLPE